MPADREYELPQESRTVGAGQFRRNKEGSASPRYIMAAAIIKLSPMASKPDLEFSVRLSDAIARHSVSRTEATVVGPLSLEVGSGEFVSVIGPAGCGKSLLLRVIAGLNPLESGSIEFGGEGQVSRPNIGFVFRDSVLLPWRSVLQNTTLQAELRGLSPPASERRARSLLAAMSLAGKEDALPRDLQFEEAQRAAFCRALLHNPPLLLLDDPLSCMDFLAREHMVADFQRLWMETGFAVVLAAGGISEAVQLSDRVVLMSCNPGRILQTLKIDLPRPRRLDKATTPLVAEYASRIRTVFRAQGLPY
jgi:NitT/TauT family transport system ATP-binding protein